MLTVLVYNIQNKNTFLDANTYKISKVIDEQNVLYLIYKIYIKYSTSLFITSLVKIKFYGFWRKTYAQKSSLVYRFGN